MRTAKTLIRLGSYFKSVSNDCTNSSRCNGTSFVEIEQETKKLTTSNKVKYCLVMSISYTDRQKIPVREFNGNFFMSSGASCSRSDVTKQTFVNVKLSKLNIALRWRKRQTVINENVSCFWFALDSSPYEHQGVKRFWKSSFVWMQKSNVLFQGYVINFTSSVERQILKIIKWRFVARSARSALGCVCFICTLCLLVKYEFR